MEYLLQALGQALLLLLSGDGDLWSIVRVSFTVSLQAIAYTTPIAFLISFILAYTRIPGRRLMISGVNTLLALPAVVVGLTLYLCLSRQGPLGDWQLLFTQSAMVIGQMLLCFPILVAMGHAALQAGDRRAWETALTLGAPPWRAMFTVMYEVRFGLLAAMISAFGRIIAEVGCSMMVGGNILHYTRNIPTAIALETSRGEFIQGIALGVVLITLALVLNFGVAALQGQVEAK